VSKRRPLQLEDRVGTLHIFDATRHLKAGNSAIEFPSLAADPGEANGKGQLFLRGRLIIGLMSGIPAHDSHAQSGGTRRRPA